MLEVKNISVRFGGLMALNDASFQVGRGTVHALIGPNGAGKTTMFNVISGVQRPDAGRILVGGADITKLPLHRRASCGMARTFQNIRLFSGMTVLENLLVAQHMSLTSSGLLSPAALLNLPSWKRQQQAAVDKALYWLHKIGLVARSDDPAGDLPYGDQRRLEIARAMCTSPVLLCLDEPAAGLNPRESAALNELLLSIRHEHQTSILLIEHDMSVVMEISDHVVVLEYGCKIADGTPEEVRNDPRVIASYLGVEEDETAVVAAEVGA